MRAFRLVRKKYRVALSGKGAARSGNRWNSKGTEMIYCAESRALAVAEVAVHLSLATLPSDYMMLEIEIPATVSSKTLHRSSLPSGWNDFPHSFETQHIGDTFIQSSEVCVLKVPSAVVQGDHNLLINPNHSDITKIKVIDSRDFPLDERLFV